MQRRRAHPLARIGRRAVERLAGVPAGSTDSAVTRDLQTPMPDGSVLLGDLYRPRGAAALPVVLIRTPYGRAGLLSRAIAIVLARHGFQVFVQSVRGTFGSGGQFRPFSSEHEDGLATLAWVRAQRWCDGRVAMTGGSYFAHTQWAVAPYADPPLESVSLHITAADMSSPFYEGGAPGMLNALTWSYSIGRQERRGVAGLLAGVGRHRRVVAALAKRPLRNADIAVTGQRVPFWRDFSEHAEPGDRFWRTADHTGADLARMPPANMVTGWWDLFLPAQLRDFARLQQAGVPARLTVGPWLHGALPELRELLRSDLAWLDHHLRGGPAPQGAPVRVWLQQADRWLDLPLWPPPGTATDVRYLGPGGVLVPTAPASSGGGDEFVFDPADPTPFPGGPLLAPPGLQADDRPAEVRPDVLVYTGPVEPRDLDLLGAPTVRVHVAAEREYADVFVRLCDVDPKGRSRNVVDGIRRLDPRTVPAADVAVAGDATLAVDVELYPTAYRIRAGHRLRVVVAGGSFPRYAPNPGTGEALPHMGTGRPGRIRVLHDAAHPSSVALPVLPAG